MPRIECRPETGPAKSFELAPGGVVVLGRAEEADLRLEDEPRLSRRHAELSVENGRLRVKRLPEASNPIFRGGTASAEFELEAGEYFVIGRTRFWFFGDGAPAARSAAAKLMATEGVADTLTREELYSLGTVGPTDRLRLRDLLELPGLLRLRSRGDFYGHVASLLRHATGAQWACACDDNGAVLGQDGPGDAAGRLSRTVVAKALAEAPRPTLYRWDAAAVDVKATALTGVDWAICAAASAAGEPARLFYAAGAGQRDPADLRACAQFVGLVSDIVSRAVGNDRLQAEQGRLQHFFAGPVIEKVLQAADPAALTPRAASSTIMFFDIREFSKLTEQKSATILQYVAELRAAMTAMTEIILREHGVVLLYMGDGILACWNVPFAEPDHVDRACRAALEMSVRLGAVTRGWRCGIGMHTGEVVAGALGSDQIFSYGVLGAVVNQASRIEGLTKLLEVPILVTETVARAVSAAVGSCARVGRFQPAGMDAGLDLYALRGPGGADPSDATYADALAAFERGDFDGALQRLGALPQSYGPAKFLAAQAIEKKRYPPPAGWDGLLKITQK
jgi:adenylate cyclase